MNLSDKILIAVSGGIDSMVLLYLFYKFDFQVAIAHCNYKLRGNDSNEDQKFIQNVATGYCIECFIKDCGDELAKQPNVQIGARALRYKWFNELCKQEQINFIATAHQCNDSIETVMLNFARGTGIKGVCGIPFFHSNLIRPLLEVSREEILSYALKNNLEWRDDISNISDKYARNKVRHHIVPVLKELNPSLEKTFKSTIFRLNTIQNFWQKEIDKICKDHLLRQDNSEASETPYAINIAAILSYPHGIVVLAEILLQFDFSFNQVYTFFCKKQNSGARLISKDYILSIDRDYAHIKKKTNYATKDLSMHYITKEDSTIKIDNATLKLEQFAYNSPLNLLYSDNVCYMDEELVSYPLSIRFPNPGDWFCPFGMHGKRKKLSDFFIDSKLSNDQKPKVLLLLSNDKIVWVIGMRNDNRFRISDSTKKILKISIKSIGN